MSHKIKKTKVKRHLRRLKKKRKVAVVRKHKRRIKKKRRNRQAIVGFNPEDKQRIQSILDKNPRLKFKVERLFSDLVHVENIPNRKVGGFVEMVAITPSKEKELRRMIADNIKQTPLILRELQLQSLNEKLLKIKDKSTKLNITPFGLEKDDKRLKEIIEHETTHKAHVYRIGKRKIGEIRLKEIQLGESIGKQLGDKIKRLYLTRLSPIERKVFFETNSVEDVKKLRRKLKESFHHKQIAKLSNEEFLNFIKLLRESKVPPLKEKPKIWMPETLGYKKNFGRGPLGGILSELRTTPKKVLIKNLKDEFGYTPEKGMEKPQLMVIYKDFAITKKLEEKARQRKIVEDFFRVHRRKWAKQYQQRPEVKAQRLAYQIQYRQRPETKVQRREYRQRPEVRAIRNVWRRQYHQRPEIKARHEEQRQRYLKKKKDG